MPGAQIDVEQAHKAYSNGVVALAATDLRVETGEFVTLLGPSGCGKSTLLRMIAGLTPVSGGRITVPSRTLKGALGFVFQQATLMPWASVRRNARLPLELHGVQDAVADAGVDEALALVGLADFASARPRELSGGMQMRASIARALVTHPRVLLMDEPFGALDEITRNRLDVDIRRLWAEQGLTILFITHSIYEAVFLSTRVLVMSRRPGRIIGEVPIDEAHPRSDDFRTSERFAVHCRKLSELLAAGSEADAA